MWVIYVIYSSFTDVTQVSVVFIYLVQTVSIQFILSGYFFFRQLCLRFQPKEKIVSCVMSKEKAGNNLSVWPVWCFSICSPRVWSDNHSIETYRWVSRSIHALVNARFTRWSDIILAVYPSLSLSDQPASCSSAPAGWQRNCSAQASVKLQETPWKHRQDFQIKTLLESNRTRMHWFIHKYFPCICMDGEVLRSFT